MECPIKFQIDDLNKGKSLGCKAILILRIGLRIKNIEKEKMSLENRTGKPAKLIGKEKNLKEFDFIKNRDS